MHSSSTDVILHIQHKELHTITEVGIEEVWRWRVCEAKFWVYIVEYNRNDLERCKRLRDYLMQCFFGMSAQDLSMPEIQCSKNKPHPCG